jgi:LysM repeat protein
MNNESPLVPQGSFMEQKNRSRARVKIAVFVVLAIHGVGLLALLMQGCKPTGSHPTDATQAPTNNVPVFEQPTNPPVVTDTNVVVTPPPPETNVVITPPPVTPVTPPPAAKDHKIVQGDTFGSIAKKYGVSVKALTDANPGLEPTKLRVGQSIHVPAPQSSGTTPVTPPANGGTGAEQTYTVKSGDSLIKIAAQYGTSAKALRAANNLNTDRIRVGQKLVIPGKTNSAAPAAPSGAEPTATPPGR